MDEFRQFRRTWLERGVPADADGRSTLRNDDAQAMAAPIDAGALVQQAAFVELEPLGRGGMCTVFRATQAGLMREVAVKRPSDRADAETEQLLLREAIIAGKLEHPNIVPVHQLVVDAHGPAVVMKRIAGQTWDELVFDPDVSLEEHLDVFVQASNAVSFAHSRGVVHRDIKPSNIMVGGFGEVYLLDWGVAKELHEPHAEAIVGTPCYMAPEMADGEADERTDVFLLGATLHEVLTGTTRHQGSSALELLYAAMYVEPYSYPPSVPAELAEICNRACARDPVRRFESVAELREAVVRFREHKAASSLAAEGTALLRQLEQDIERVQRPDAQEHDRDTLQHRFAQTRVAFEAALRAWPESPSAQSGLERCLQKMIDHELDQCEPEAAASLLGLLGTPDEPRRQRLAAVRAKVAQERRRWVALERDQDPSVGALGRTRAYLALGALTAVMTSLLVVRRQWLPAGGPSTGRLTVVGALVLLIMLLVVALWRRFGAFNELNRRVARLSVATLALSFANRLSGWVTDAAPEQVLIHDALLLGLGGVALSHYHRAGPWLLGLALSVAAIGSFLPSVVDDLFIALSVLVPAGLSLVRRGELWRPGATPRGDAP